jgi:anti-anti-sigma regulatory factor
MEKTIDLSISIENWEGWRLVQFSGNFIVYSIPLARQRFDEEQSGRHERTALDLTRVTGFDASAMCMILNFNMRIIRNNGTMVVIGPNETIREAFARLRFDAEVPIFDTADLFMRSHLAS